eukprot:GHVU01199205.1.p1 GENE.GHVU01199205.1~~GHVU01199205.1.p1  ORF type:complete len:224 (+),score=15.28 GHVU01199205.1:1408-2079(+)
MPMVCIPLCSPCARSTSLPHIQASKILAITREHIPATGGAIVPVSPTQVSRVVRGVVALSTLFLSQLAKRRTSWCASISFDGCSNSSFDLMNVRVRFPTEDGVESFIVMLAPDVHTADELTEYILDLMRALNEELSKKLYGVTADGCSVNTGVHTGVFTQLQNVCEGPMVFIHCPLHQMHLISGEVVEGLGFGDDGGLSFPQAISKIHDIDLKPQCPALSDRW